MGMEEIGSREYAEPEEAAAPAPGHLQFSIVGIGASAGADGPIGKWVGLNVEVNEGGSAV